MLNYKKYVPFGTNNEIIIRMNDMANIPKSENNADYIEYLEWVAEGNEAEEYIPIQPE